MPAAPDASPAVRPVVVAEVVRSGFVEGHHYGSWVVLDADGSILASAGDVTGPMLPRSCNKPIQALGMLEEGLDLDGELLALTCASHSGEAFHIDGVRRILDSAGLSEADLQTPPDHPLDDKAREAALRAGVEKSPLLMNCSGKHAAMLATCRAQGWPIDTYREPAHPLQQAILRTFERMTGEPVAHTAVDGCGAPLLSTSLTGLARAFSRLAQATPDSSPKGFEHRVATAIREHPEYVSGTTRDELALLRAIPGAIGKAGAESCYAVALPDGRAIATKTDDGAARARPVVMAALLEGLGVTELPGVDGDEVRRTGEAPVLGGGRPVGEIRAVAPM